MPGVTAHLVCAGAAKAIEFYKQAFGAVEMMRIPGEGGKLMHAAVSINGARVMLVDEFPDHHVLGPLSLKGTPVTLHLNVADVDKFIDTAVGAGAKLVMPVADMFWGDRYGIVEDPFGHRWSVATPIRKLSEEELRAASKEAMAQR
ncbi:MAG: VOC family protein [Alphaproteobacteria bacterium]|nr:VOC family protein [Alphaproteobacteria bacterium]